MNKVVLNKVVFVELSHVMMDYQTALEHLDDGTQDAYLRRMNEMPGVYSLMNPVFGALAGFEKLAQHHDVCLVSTPSWDNESAWTDKLEWVKRHFGESARERIITTHRKDLLAGDVLVDGTGNFGTEGFAGEVIRFGSDAFPHWNALLDHLIPVAVAPAPLAAAS